MTSPVPLFHRQDLSTRKQEAQTLGARLEEDNLYPFGPGDTSAGMEYELQVAVEGQAEDVDLVQSIRQSNFFKNVIKRSKRGDLARSSVLSLEDYLENNETGVWENSWVRLQEVSLSKFARQVIRTDMLADKRIPDGTDRADVQRFKCLVDGKPGYRIPVSYLLKVALADAITPGKEISDRLHRVGINLLSHFTSDNTSPEVLSLTIPDGGCQGVGTRAAKEAARTFLFIQLLVQYANTKFGLQSSGQKVLVYNAPHAPHRQKKLNQLVPDGYYRHLFMSPCLSGWDRGEDKTRYMALCHQTLSRSQLNAIGKLKDAGIITNNLVVLPNTSNTCLANNGTHVSLGSELLTAMAREKGNGFSREVEKYWGDLVIKIVEHFLPLFVGSYTAAPYKLDFADFHPEQVLGFLPHELDYTHLRMIWRRWKKKADISYLGKSITPFGPRGIDQFIARVLRLHGDLVPDFRLIDYFITLLSTGTSPALDGTIGNQQQLKAELSEMGIFDHRMSMYLPYRLRSFGQIGYSGFEGRSYSLFPSFLGDMSEAVDLQSFLTAAAYRMVIKGRVKHDDIPDDPSIESERRQIFFGAAIGLPTLYVRTATRNTFLQSILRHSTSSRKSRRYRGYTRLKLEDLRLAMVRFLETDDPELVTELGAEEILKRLKLRIQDRGYSASGRLLKQSMQLETTRKRPEWMAADQFNSITEKYYRTELRENHLQEGLQVLLEDCRNLERAAASDLQEIQAKRHLALPLTDYLDRVGQSLLAGTSPVEDVQTVLQICLAAISLENSKNRNS